MTEREKLETWQMIMDLAREAGFVRFAYAGVALLDMNKEEAEK